MPYTCDSQPLQAISQRTMACCAVERFTLTPAGSLCSPTSPECRTNTAEGSRTAREVIPARRKMLIIPLVARATSTASATVEAHPSPRKGDTKRKASMLAGRAMLLSRKIVPSVMVARRLHRTTAAFCVFRNSHPVTHHRMRGKESVRLRPTCTKSPRFNPLRSREVYSRSADTQNLLRLLLMSLMNNAVAHQV